MRFGRWSNEEGWRRALTDGVDCPMPSLTVRPFRELLAEFASSAPTPGGGSAAALTASVALSLLTMVARMPRTRGGSAEERATLDRRGEELQKLGEHTVELVDE